MPSYVTRMTPYPKKPTTKFIILYVYGPPPTLPRAAMPAGAMSMPLATVIILSTSIYGGRDSSVGTATRYWLDGPVIETRWGARFSAPVQTSPWAHPVSYTTGTGSFPKVKRPGCGVYHPPPSSAEVKERVELYHYSPSGPSGPVPE
jgi:hypothetical protein